MIFFPWADLIFSRGLDSSPNHRAQCRSPLCGPVRRHLRPYASSRSPHRRHDVIGQASPRVALHCPRLSSPHVVLGQATLKPSPPNLCRAKGARPRGRWCLPQLMLEQVKLEHASRPRRPHPPRLREPPLERGNDGVKEGRVHPLVL